MKAMQTRDFKVFLEPDADYGGYVVVCPSIPGCYSQGKNVPEALANILEDMDSRGEEIPDPQQRLDRKRRRHPMSPKLPVISGADLVKAGCRTLRFPRVRFLTLPSLLPPPTFRLAPAHQLNL